MELILLRHGATAQNLERRFLGITDVPLAPQGASQALALAPKMPRVDHLYVSPLIRCRQTAVLVWPDVEQTVIPELRETDFGPFEGKTHEELVEDELYNLWISCPEDPEVVPMVEDAAACGARAGTALMRLCADASAKAYRSVAVVSHGGTLMSILARYGHPQRDYYSWRMENCGGFFAQVDIGTMQILVKDSF